MTFNEFQSTLEELNINGQEAEIQEQFFDYINNVPNIRNYISINRPRAKDIPKDKEGKIIIDCTVPHILEDMQYFRPAALHYEKYGCYTKLRPNRNPNSEYYKWIREEYRRCWYGYVRPSDGEWITGDYYFYLNYCPILLIKKNKEGINTRVLDFPRVWDGQYYKFHFLNQCRKEGHHYMELASRGKGKSFSGASLLAKRFILGESNEVKKKVQCMVTASEKKYLVGGNQILNMFQSYIDFNSRNSKDTGFPYMRAVSSLQNMQWTMGYTNNTTKAVGGSLNSVTGITSKDDESKLRGTRGVLYIIEESGTFPRLLKLWSVMRPSVEDGKAVFGTLMAYGTAGDNDSDFSSMQEMMYNPDGYNLKGIKNVFDKEGQGRVKFTYFYPAYLNMAECYDENGNSDVTKALLLILQERYKIKYNSTDINAITKRIAEYPITPQEAIIRSHGNIFPITQLNERLNEIDNNPSFFNDVYVGELIQDKNGKVEFNPTNEMAIRDFPTKDNKIAGAVEIYEMPQEIQGKVPRDRYIASLDNYENDTSNTMSLGSLFVLDLWTDRIVAEYTGRPMFVDDLNEIARRMCIFYNCSLLYENNKRNTFSYFSKTNSLYMLEDTPEYLRQRQLIKNIGYGNSAKGVSAIPAIKNHGFTLIRDWLLKPVTIVVKEGENESEITVPNLHFLKNRALIKELILFNPDINVDRVMSMVQLMIFRESKMILYQGEITKRENDSNVLANDDFFKRNFDTRFSK